MENIMKSIKVSSKLVSIIMKIAYITMIVMVCACAVGLIVVAASDGEESVEIGGVTIMETGDAEESHEEVMAICAELCVMGAFLFAICLFAHRVFHEISLTGAPFNAKYGKSIRIIGILVAAMSAARIAVGAGVEALWHIKSPGEYVNAPGVLIGVVIFCIAYVFDYGCALQNKYEELK